MLLSFKFVETRLQMMLGLGVLLLGRAIALPWDSRDGGRLSEAVRTENSALTAAVCLGMSFWKRRRIAEFLGAIGLNPIFLDRVDEAVALAVEKGGLLAVWGGREMPGLTAAASAAKVPLARIEDGFLRSVGLGADFTQAVSIVVDRTGIYYDPTGPSDLENILNEAEFGADLIARARRLRQLVVSGGITKYNVGADLPDIADAARGRRRIFIPGQVEDDRSVLLGGAGIKTNLELLETVRGRNPDAFILYKPHPDVDAGHRQGAVSDERVRRFADGILRNVSSDAILAAVHEVHTLTSLAGFEALLRGLKVVVHGRPFYAGWGLTADLAPPPRRRRVLTLDELVAGVLILYPLYLDPVTRQACGPETVIERFAEAALWRPSPLVRLRRLQGLVARRWRGLGFTSAAENR
jgi:capsular polysaccharide export protein